MTTPAAKETQQTQQTQNQEKYAAFNIKQ